MHLIVVLIVFVGLAAIIVWVADWTSGSEETPQPLTFSIDALPAARSTGRSMTRNAG
jgi:hypothetical protein